MRGRDVLERQRQLRERVEIIRLKHLARKHAKYLPSYVNLDELYSELRYSLDLLLYDLRYLASVYRFFCVELAEQCKSNKYVKLVCENTKVALRTLLLSIKARIEFAKDNIGRKENKYVQVVEDLGSIEHLVNEFLKAPEVSLSDVLKALELREKDVQNRELRLQRWVDRMIQFLEEHGYVIVNRRGKIRTYVCTLCDREFLSEFDYIMHFVEQHVKTVEPGTVEVEGESEEEQEDQNE